MKRAFLLLLLLSMPFAQFGDILGEGVVVPETPPTLGAVDIPSSGIGAMPLSPYIRPPAQPCEECPTEAEMPFLFSSVDLTGKKVSSSLAVERGGRRVPVEGATLFFQVFDETGHTAGMCRAYTNSNGTAEFSYERYDCDKGCSIKTSFCCSNPVTQSCVLPPCLGTGISDFSSISACSGYGESWPSNATVAGEEVVISPMFDTVHVPPKEVSSTAVAFALCLPLLAVFGFLGAAMFASGRDPFAMFSFYTPRYTRGAERPIGARGVTISAASIANALVQGLLKPAIKAGRDAASAREAEAAAAPQAQTGRVATVRTAAAERAASGGRGGAADAQAGAAPRSAGAAAPRQGLQAPEMDTRAAALTGTIGQKFILALGRLIAGDAGAMGDFFANMKGSLRVSAADAGMGTGEFFARLGNTLIMYMIPIWWVGELASGAINQAIVEGVAGERNARYCETVIPAIDNGTVVLRDRNGDVVGYRIQFRNPVTGEVVTRDLNRADGEVFLQTNKHVPMQIAQTYQMNMQVEANRLTVGAVSEDFRRNCGTMAEQGLREFWAAEGGDLRGAAATLLDANATREAKLAAFEAICRASGHTSEATMLAAAVLCSGMNHAELAALVGGSREFGSFITKIGNEDFSARAAESGTANIIAAISITRGAFENVLDTREEREANQDPARLGWALRHLGVEIQESDMGRLGYREGTNDYLARMAIAGGLAGIAASSEVAGMSAGDRADIRAAYLGIMQEREEFLGRPMTNAEQRDFVPLTEEGKQVFARMQEIGRYDAMCGAVAGTVNEVREASRDPALAGRDPAYAGSHSTYEEIQRQAASQGIQALADDVSSGRSGIGYLPDEARGRVGAYIALGMVGAETASLASQAVAAEAQGRSLEAIREVSEMYDMSYMDASKMAQVLTENERLRLVRENARYGEYSEALETLRRADATEAELRAAAGIALGDDGARVYLELRRAPDSEENRLRLQYFDGIIEGGIESIQARYRSEEYLRETERVGFLGSAMGLITPETYTATHAIQWVELRAAYEGRTATDDEVRLASTNPEAVHAEAIGYIEAYARGRAQELGREIPSAVERYEGIIRENLALQAAHASQTRLATDEGVRDVLERAAGTQQDFDRQYRETETGAVVPREESEYARAARRTEEARRAGRVPGEEIPR